MSLTKTSPHAKPVRGLAEVQSAFLRNVRVTAEREDCWPWTGPLGSTGYPTSQLPVNWGMPFIKANASRISLALFKGIVLEPGRVAMHTCDNKICVNPHHLRDGSQSENLRDCVAKGRHVSGWEARFRY